MSTRVLASLLAAAAMFGSLPLWWWLQQRDAPPAAESARVQDQPSEPTPPAEVRETAAPEGGFETGTETALSPEPIRPGKPQPELITGPDPGRSPLADRLNAPDGSIDLDLAIVHKVLANYAQEFGSNPVGANREVTAQLSGRNPQRHAPLPADLPAISSAGELIDRWGTPFFFHALSAREMEIRSAGPDRELYTADDAVWTPGPK
jgi:hypothetical protein